MVEEAQESLSSELPSQNGHDADLVDRCIHGDQEAWDALVEKYKDLVWSVPLKYRLSREDCADIFQSVWLDLFRDLKKLRFAGAVRSWLVTTAAHKCFHWKEKQQTINRKSGELESDPVDDRPSLVSLKVQAEREQLLREGMAELSARCQELVTMLFFEHPPVPYEDVASRLGLAVGSIGFIRGRCLKKLRDRLTERGF